MRLPYQQLVSITPTHPTPLSQHPPALLPGENMPVLLPP